MFENVKQEIDDKIKTNGNNEITATRLNSVLQDMMDAAAEEIENVAESVGDQVEANPTGEATEPLNTIKIGETTYKTGNPFAGEVDVTDAERLQALANVSNQEAGYDSSEPPVFTGKMGYVVLQPETDDKTTFAAQIANKPNTIFEIRDVFDLGGTQETPISVTLPAGSTLKFNGGVIKNCTIEGDDTYIDGSYKFDNVKFSGNFTNTELVVDNEHFSNSTDFFGILRSFSTARIELYKNIEVLTFDSNTIGSVNLNGNGYTIKVGTLTFNSTANIYLENCKFDCSLSQQHTTEYGFLNIMGNGTNDVKVINCSFTHVQDGINHTYFRNVNDILIDGCSFEGDFTDQDTAGGRVVFGYSYHGIFTVKNTTIRNCSGIGIEGLTGTTYNYKSIISNCIIDSVGLGGIVFQGGLCVDSVVENCVITNTNLTNQSGKVAENAAINFHGYKNAFITNNTINTPNSCAIDMEGKDGETNNKGDGCIVSHNNFIGTSINFLNSKNTVFDSNNVDLSGNIKFSGKVLITNNNIKVVSTSTNSAYGLHAISSESVSFDLDAKIFNNRVTIKPASSSYLWFFYANSVIRQNDKVEISDVLVYNEKDAKTPTLIFTTGVVELLDGIDKVLVPIDLSQPLRTIIINRGRKGRIKDVEAFAHSEVTISPAINVHLGLFRPGVGVEAASFGDLSLSGKFRVDTTVISLNGQKPNNEVQNTVGDVYASYAGSESLTGTIYLLFTITNGKYKLYY